MAQVPPSLRYPSSAPSLRLVGRYLLCDVIASGGMATVHLGRLVGDEGFSRTVAIKQLYQHFARSQDFVTMFLDEARILSRIRHPHVIAPLDVVVLEGELFIVMEYVHGASLAELMDANARPMPPRIASAIVGQMLLGLHAAHEATSETGAPLSIVHRDVSPHNVLVGADGVARVVDFGIAKAQSRARTTGDGSLKGKLGYMAPEQLRGLPVDRRTDIFTAGTVLWEALTGERLYVAESVPALFDELEHRAFVAPSSRVPGLPGELDEVARQALTLNVEDRFATAREMAVALERAVPPASSLEVSEWVDQLIGSALSVRAERIVELESLNLRELTLARPRFAPKPDASVQAPVAPTQTPTMTAALSGMQVSHDLASVSPRKRSRAGLAAALALVSLLAAAGAALVFARQQTGDPRVAPAATTDSKPASSTPSEPVLAPPRALSAEPTQAPDASANVTPSAPPPLPKHPATTRVSATPKSAASAKSAAPAKSGNSNSARPQCAVPYTVDEHGVKRFKPECF